MADNSAKSSAERFRQLIDRIDEQEGAASTGIGPAARAPATPPPAPAYRPTGDKQIVPVRSKIDSAAPEKEAKDARRFSAWEAFKTFAIIFSFAVNLILVLVVVGLVAFMFQIKRGVAEPLLGGLYNGFVAMDEAHIKTSIPVNTTIPVNDKVTADFNLPLQQTTNVILAENTLITGASVTIQGGVLQLNNAPTTIVLPRGTVLPITLDLDVPVKQDIPINLHIPVSIPVAVDIPLHQTELHQPFADLRDLFAPYYLLMSKTPSSWAELVTGK